ncbi:MAG: metal-dependent phosphohydrolase, partial [Pirellulales bacterium]
EVLEGQQVRIQHAPGPPSPLLEVQVVEAADSITYDTHDADDALEMKLLSLDELLATPLWSAASKRVLERAAGLTPQQVRRAVLHELIDWQVGDLLVRATARLAEKSINSPQAARQARVVIVAGDELAPQKRQLEAFLRERVYRHPDLLVHRKASQAALAAMFHGYLARPDLLPEGFRRRAEAAGLERTVGDYLAGMTDRFAWREYQRLFAA